MVEHSAAAASPDLKVSVEISRRGRGGAVMRGRRIKTGNERQK